MLGRDPRRVRVLADVAGVYAIQLSNWFSSAFRQGLILVKNTSSAGNMHHLLEIRFPMNVHMNRGIERYLGYC